MKEKLLGKTLDELKEAASLCGLKSFVGRQLADWLYAKRAVSWDAMVNISKSSKAALQERYDLGTYGPAGIAESSDGTKKYLFTLPYPETPDDAARPDGSRLAPDLGCDAIRLVSPPGRSSGQSDRNAASSAPSIRAVEAVMIPDEDRRTLCVSSQAGCKMGCRFCMTGRQGFHGNLSAADILNQFISIDESSSLTNTVFMGMGEPLDNYAEVKRAIDVLTADWGFGWSPKRITLSTIGVLPNLKRFLDETRCHLAVSLHNPFPEERYSMMPVQKGYPLRDILDLLKHYDFSGQRRVSFEYTMFAGWNDDIRHADALARILKGLECRVNLIRFHRIPDFPYGSSEERAMESFRDRLESNGIICTIRASRGEDILAACGLLAGQFSERR